MSEPDLVADVSFAWWWRFYLWGLIFFATAMRLEPDWDKFEAVVMRAIRVRVRRNSQAPPARNPKAPPP